MITKKQKQVLDFIREYIKKRGYAPSLEDIKNAPLQTSGGTIKVSDVANVIDGFDEASTISRL